MLRTIFVLIILVPGLAAAFASRFAALLVYLWFSLFRPQDWLWIDITPLRMSLVLSLLVVVPRGWLFSDSTSSHTLKQRLAIEAWPNVTHPLTIGMLLLFITSLVAQIHAVDPDLGLVWLDYLWRVFLVAMVAVSLINTKERFLAVVMVMTASFGFHTTKAGITSLLGGGVRYDQGLGGAFIDNNGYALAIAMILPFLVAVGQNARQRWLRWVFLAAVLPSIYTIVSTFSRAGFLSAVTVVVAFAALQRRRVVGLLALAVVGLLALAVVPIPKGYLDRLETIQTYEQIGEESALSRLHFWKVAVDMVRDRPEGIGLRNYDSAYDRYDFSGGRYGRGRSVHSSHFQILAENGYAGFVIWVGQFVCAFFLCARIRARSRHVALSEYDQRLYFTMANALMVSMVGFLVGRSFIALALNNLTWLTFALIAALNLLSARELAQSVSTSASFKAPPAVGGSAGSGSSFQGEYRQWPEGTNAGDAERPSRPRPES